MSAIDDILHANGRFVRKFDLGRLHAVPAKRLAILTCMDARIPVFDAFGLEPGDAHIIRNAGAIMTEDALRSLIVSHHLLGTREFMVVAHTKCGALNLDDGALRTRLEKETGASAAVPASFHGFENLEESVRRQIEILRSHPWIPRELPIRGFIYDVTTGRLNEVPAARSAGS